MPPVTPTKPLLVRVEMTLPIDAEGWATECGMDPSDRATIRADVKSVAHNAVYQRLTDLGLLVTDTR